LPRGPLPDPKHHRRHAPTIPTTKLPARGRSGPAPRIPKGALGAAGTAWWKWAWATPQAAAWDPGAFSVLLRRAALEDDLATSGRVEGLDFLEVLESETQAEVRRAVSRLASLATGRLGIMREMRELDDRLGLTPKAMAQLRWTVVAEDPADQAADDDSGVARLEERRRRLASA